MENCLKTQLKQKVQNGNLLKIGWFTVNVDSPERYVGLNFQFNSYPVTAEIDGDGFFCDSSRNPISPEKSLTLNSTSDKIYASPGTYKINISNKYDVTTIVPTGGAFGRDYSISEDVIKYAANLFRFYDSSIPLRLNLSNLIDKTNLQIIESSDGIVCPWYGSLKFIEDCPNLREATIFSVPKENFTDIVDLSKTNAYIFWVANGLTAKWKTQRESSKFIVAMYNTINFGEDLDTMLINQATCEKLNLTNTSPWFWTINANGTKTSASDNAVATLKSKGYTVIINGETL